MTIRAEEKSVNAWINHIQRFCTSDGPGIRTTVFFQGCNLACQWCHNPDTISRKPAFRFVEQKCRFCQACAQACAYGALTWEERPRWKSETCRQCGVCGRACLVGAASLSAQWLDVDTVLHDVLRDKPFYDASGGGVTCSGGEPMLALSFLGQFLRQIKEQGIHTAVDTAACVPWDGYEAIMPAVDLFLVDFKLDDAAAHRAYTGVDNRLIRDNMRRFVTCPVPVIVRVPVIPTVNDHFLSAMAEFLREIDFSGPVQLLRYHRLGEHKYRALGIEPPLKHLTPPEEEQLCAWRTVFEEAGLVVLPE